MYLWCGTCLSNVNSLARGYSKLIKWTHKLRVRGHNEYNCPIKTRETLLSHEVMGKGQRKSTLIGWCCWRGFPCLHFCWFPCTALLYCNEYESWNHREYWTSWSHCALCPNIHTVCLEAHYSGKRHHNKNITGVMGPARGTLFWDICLPRSEGKDWRPENQDYQ